MQHETSENEIYEKMSTENIARIHEIEEINIKLNTVKKEIHNRLDKENEELRIRMEKETSEVHFHLDETKKKLQTEIDENYSTNTTKINDLADNLANMFKSAIAKMADENNDRIHEIEGWFKFVFPKNL